MKKLLARLILAALLIGTLGACGDRDSDLDIRDYRVLMREMAVLAEYRFVGDVTIIPGRLFRGADMRDDLFEEVIPTRFRVEGAVSHANRQMAVLYVHETAQGEQIFDMGMILHPRAMYVELPSVLEQMLRPMLESFGRETAEFEIADILGNYRYLIIPHGREVEDMLFAPTEIGGEVNLERFLTRDGGHFTITLEGEDVQLVLDDVSQVLAQFTAHSDFVGGDTRDVFGDVSRQLARADLRDARALIVTSRSEDAFYQTVELQVGELIDIRANFTFTAEAINPIGAPANALTENGLTALLLSLDWNTLFPEIEGTEEPEEEEDTLTAQEDLYSLDLINPVLTEPTFLELVEIGTALAGEVLDMVAVIADADVTAGAFHLTVDAEAIGMIYTLIDGMSAVETVLSAVVYDQVGTFLPDSQIKESVLRTNEGHTMAAMAVAEETVAEGTRLHIYLAQRIDEDTVLRLELLFDLDLFTDETHEIVTELSQQFGINLGAYITELLSEL